MQNFRHIQQTSFIKTTLSTCQPCPASPPPSSWNETFFHLWVTKVKVQRPNPLIPQSRHIAFRFINACGISFALYAFPLFSFAHWLFLSSLFYEIISMTPLRSSMDNSGDYMDTFTHFGRIIQSIDTLTPYPWCP